MKILALEREAAGTTADQYARCLKAEAAHVWALYQAGIIGKTHLDADRHPNTGIIAFNLITLIPHSGFARLFCPDSPPA